MEIKENKSLFLSHFGDTPQLRVVDFLIDNHFFDFPITEIAKGSNVSYNSIKKFFKSFIASGMIIKTRKIRKSDYYQLNMNSPFVKNLISLDWSLVKSSNSINSEEVLVEKVSR
jgi:predicted transcriptional regulator